MKSLTALRQFLIALLFVANVAAAAQSASAKVLFGSIGSVGTMPYDVGATPPDRESWYAVVVVEVDSTASTANVPVSGFRLIDAKGGAIDPSRILSIEELDSSRAADTTADAYWTQGKANPWDGILPIGKVRLRIRAAFAAAQEVRSHDVREFKVTVGTHAISGKICCRLAS